MRMKPKLIADAMLGRLARWLRLYGYDVIYGLVDDDEILKIAEKEDRLVLTRDSGLAERSRRVILLRSNKLEEQFEELKNFGFTFEELFPPNARCPKCNGLIRKAEKEEIKSKVPHNVYAKYNEFYVCTKCGQIYWPGRQWNEMIKIDRKLRNKNKRT